MEMNELYFLLRLKWVKLELVMVVWDCEGIENLDEFLIYFSRAYLHISIYLFILFERQFLKINNITIVLLFILPFES